MVWIGEGKERSEEKEGTGCGGRLRINMTNAIT